METEQKTMSFAWQDKSTAATIGLFLVSGITGLMLFFKLGEGAVKGIHEWLSVAFVLASMLHIARHWRPLQRYFVMRSFWVISAIVLVATGLIMAPGAGSHGPGGRPHPMMQTFDALGAARLENLALTLNTSSEKLVARLKAEGIAVQNPQQTLQEVAAGANRELPQVLSIVMAGEVAR